MPPSVDTDPAQLLQPLPLRDINRQVGSFEPVRRHAAGLAAGPAAAFRFSAVSRPAAPPAGGSPPAPRLPPPTRLPPIAAPEPGTVLDRRPAQTEIAERFIVPERLYHLFNETRGRTEIRSVLERIVPLRQLVEADVQPAAAGETESRENPTAVTVAPAAPAPESPPIRVLAELTPAPARAGVFQAAEIGNDIRQARAREEFQAAIRDGIARREGGIGAAGVRQVLIDQTI